MIFQFLFLILLLQQHLDTINDSYLLVCHVDQLLVQGLCKCVTPGLHLQHWKFGNMIVIMYDLGSSWHNFSLPTGDQVIPCSKCIWARNGMHLQQEILKICIFLLLRVRPKFSISDKRQPLSLTSPSLRHPSGIVGLQVHRPYVFHIGCAAYN